MRISRPWRIIAGAGTATAVLGLGATSVAANHEIGLWDRGESVPVENVHIDGNLDDSPASADSPFGDSSIQSASADSPTSPDSPASAHSAASVASADSPASPPSPDSPDSADSGGSADSGDSADSAD